MAGHLGRGLFLQLNALATRLHFAKYAFGVRPWMLQNAYRRRIDSGIPD